MKKIFSCLFIAVFILFAGGCHTKNSSNNINVIYEEENVIFGVKNSVEQVKNFSFSGNLIIDNKRHDISGKVILGDSISVSAFELVFDDTVIYVVDEKVYISYVYNNSDIIIRDSLDVFVHEVCMVLSDKNINCKLDEINELINSGFYNSIDFTKLENINIEKENNNHYLISNDNLVISLDDRYLPNRLDIEKENISLEMEFNYDDLTIKVPFKYDIFPFNIGQIKRLLDVDNLSDLID